jgi:outer membrane biosynthesis protein TonB
MSGLVMKAPSYPKRCKREKIEGVTEVAVEFRADGSVEKTHLKIGSDACPEFSAVSLKAAANARFVISPETHFFRYAMLPFRFRLNR